MLNTHDKVAIYMESNLDSDYGKTGMGIIRYLSNPITCVIDSLNAGSNISKFIKTDRDIPIVEDLDEAIKKKSTVLILGIAPSGGKIPDEWIPVIEKALKLEMSIVNGLHDLISPKWEKLIKNKSKQWIWDVRIPQFTPEIATCKAKNLKNKRVLFIGTDMAIGKMTAALEILKIMVNKKVNVGFVATGQIGIIITGKGIPLDAFRVDHACGAVEKVVLDQAEKDILLIEGQGSLLHPGSTATLPLMRGSCPTHLILCHRANKKTLRSPEGIEIPDLKEFINLNESLTTVSGTYPRAKVVGIALDTSSLNEDNAKSSINNLEKELGIPVTDLVRFKSKKLVKAILN
jgi:uncharacterized NAD-dependent epimerase/dehydratase family protein